MKFVEYQIPNIKIKNQLEQWLGIKIHGKHIRVPEHLSEATKNFIESRLIEEKLLGKE